MQLLHLIGFVACILMVADKWGLVAYYEALRKPWMPSADCFLCLSFWIALAVQIVTFGALWYAFAAAPIVQLILILTYARNTDQ